MPDQDTPSYAAGTLAWRFSARTGAGPDRMEPFAGMIDVAKKYVASGILDRLDWNAEFIKLNYATWPRQLRQRITSSVNVQNVARISVVGSGT